jgi:hypothetical protein
MATEIITPYRPGYDPPGPQLDGWQVARVAANAGFNDAPVAGVSNLVIAVAIARRESNWRTNATNASSGAKGLWQFLGHPDIPPACAYDAWCAAQKAWSLSQHGTNFFGSARWGTLPAREHLDAATAAVAEMRRRTERALPAPAGAHMAVALVDFKHKGTPPGRARFVQLIVDEAGRRFRLVVRNGAKIAQHPAGGFGVAVTQASNGLVLGIIGHPDGVRFVVTADDGGTFGYAFAP